MPITIQRKVVLMTDDRNLRVKAYTRNVPVLTVPQFRKMARLWEALQLWRDVGPITDIRHHQVRKKNMAKEKGADSWLLTGKPNFGAYQDNICEERIVQERTYRRLRICMAWKLLLQDKRGFIKQKYFTYNYNCILVILRLVNVRERSNTLLYGKYLCSVCVSSYVYWSVHSWLFVFSILVVIVD